MAIGHIQQIEYSAKQGGGGSREKERRKRIGIFLEMDIICSRVMIRQG